MQKLKQQVFEANMDLPRYGLVTFTWGNVSAIDRERGLVVIKPSGVAYETMKADDMVVVDMSGKVVEGEYELNTGKVIIETLGDAEPLHTPGIVVYQHGPFAWGKDAHDAVHNAVVMEEVAKMAWIARSINPQLNHIDSFLMNKHFMRKHGPNAYYGQK